MTETRSVWLFPGLGCRFVGMGADVLGKCAAANEVVAQANEFLGWDVLAACLKGGGRDVVPPRRESQLIYTVCCAYAAVLSDQGCQPTAVCGHSLGTWAAVHVAGGYDFLTGLKLVSWVDDALESLTDGREQAMGLVLGLPEETLTRLCLAESNAHLANINCPGQYMIGGTKASVELVLAAAQQAGAHKTKLMPITRAMHTSLLDDVSAGVGRMLAEFPLLPTRAPLVSAWDGARLTRTEEIRRYLSNFLARPVRWETAMRRLLAEPDASFIEVGPANVLSRMMPYLDHTICVPTASDVLKRSNYKNAVAEGNMIRADKRVLISGNQAVARGAYESGVRVATAYPGTPCTEILETLATHDHVQAMWSTNEKVALDTALGAALAGSRALVAMKHVGLNVAADPLFSASYTGVNAGLVIVVGDDPSAHSSQNEQDSRHYARAAKLPMLEPADSQEAKDFVRHAFELSERFQTPVMMRLTTRVCHSKSGVRLGERDLMWNGATGFVPDADRFVLLPRQALQRHFEVEKRLEALSEYAEHSELNGIYPGDNALGIIVSGVCHAYAVEAFPTASILKLGCTFPLPARLIRRFARSVERVLVLEELDDFLEGQINALGIETEGKSIIPRVGELSPQRIHASWQARAPAPVESGDLTTSPRPPRICPGCQYLGVYTVIERLNVTVTGDIGCYTLGALPPFNSLDTVVCMGSSIGLAIGMEKALGSRASGNLLAVIGDGTLLHAGIPALLDMVYNQSQITVLVMDNGTTAMTGLQGHPGNGVGLQQRQAPTVDIEKLVAAIGISWVRVVDAYDLAATERTLREALAHAGPSVVISRNPCLLLKGKTPVQQAWVDPDSCTGCGDCSQVGCIAVEFAAIDDSRGVPAEVGAALGSFDEVGTPRSRTQERKLARINLELCVGCTLCVQVCPEGAIAPRPASAPLLQISWSGTP